MRRDEERLRDILDAVAAIQRRAGNDRRAFDADELLRVWCLHHLTVIGEAVAGLSAELRGRYTSTPWRDIVGMRNAVIHGYFSVDWDEVWAVVERDLDQLAESVKDIIAAEGWES
jgi:uncharacterized protein with HEPN domain